MKLFYELSGRQLFWIVGAVYLFLMEAIALFYQYVLGDAPCALCVQIRALIFGALIFSICTSLVCAQFIWRWAGLTLTSAFLGGALYKSWYAWGVEKGNIESSCSFGAGFPDYLPLDSWIPLLFSAEGICGQSSEMWFGFSMNEALLPSLGIPLAVLFILWSLHCIKMISFLKGRNI